MRIVIDMQGAQTESRFRGIGRYSLSLAQAIARNRGDHEVLLALNGRLPATIAPIRAAFERLLPPENIHVWTFPGTVRYDSPVNAWRRSVAELIREAFLQHLNPDVIHISSIFEGFIDDAVSSIRCFDTSTPISVTHYDLIPLLNPEQYLDNSPVYASYYRQKLEQISKATLLLTISESSLQEALTHLNVQKDRVVNVSTAADQLFAIGKFNENQAAAIKQRYSIEKSFVMYTGGADVRKNLPRLLSAYAKLPVALRDSHQLVLAGKIPDFDRYKLERLAKAVGLTGGSLVFTGFVPDDEMVQLYSLCKLFVFPSWHEGFGLPALEAMACGAPVIASDNTSLPEVIGWPNAMFDPHDDAAMCRKMMEALTIEAFRTELSVRGMARSKKFSWDITARRAISAFETLPLRESVAPDKVEQQPLLPSLLSAIAKVVPPKISKSELLAIAHVLSQFCKCPTA